MLNKPYRLLIVDDKTYDKHVGEEYDDVKEVLVEPRRKQMQEMKYFFSGIIRSIYKDIGTDIEIVCDLSSPIYETVFHEIEEEMREKEGIVFKLKGVRHE